MVDQAHGGQLLHLVFGGELTDLDHVQFRDLDKLDIVGVYPNYATAYVSLEVEGPSRPSTMLICAISLCICTVCSILKRISAPSADRPVALFQCPG
jgi:hypothetical protein